MLEITVDVITHTFHIEGGVMNVQDAKALRDKLDSLIRLDRAIGLE